MVGGTRFMKIRNLFDIVSINDLFQLITPFQPYAIIRIIIIIIEKYTLKTP